jgi:6-O-methylguanine DNA methyltransferase, DNA binding domain
VKKNVENLRWHRESSPTLRILTLCTGKCAAADRLNFFLICAGGSNRLSIAVQKLLQDGAPGCTIYARASAMPPKFSSRIPWREKLERQQQPKIVDIPPRMQARLGKGRMVIPRPLDVDALIRRVRKGKLVTVLQLREELARRSGVDTACPLCTGIFVRIAAEAANEERRAGKKAITPFWRVITGEGRLNPKFPGGTNAQRRALILEGHKLSRAKGKKPPAVAGFQEALVRF